MKFAMASLFAIAALVSIPGTHAITLRGTSATDMQPEVVAKTLKNVEDNWKDQAAKFIACNATGEDCSAMPHAFSKSCSVVVGAVVQGSNGDEHIAKDYMADICSQSMMIGWHQQHCLGLKAALDVSMSADSYQNRNSFSSDRLCTKFWSSFVEEEQKRFVIEEAARLVAEKKAAEEAKKAEEEAAKKAKEAADKAEKEKEDAAKAAQIAQEEAEKKAAADLAEKKIEEATRAKEEAQKKAAEAAQKLAAKRAEAEELGKQAKAKMEEATKAEEEHKALLAKVTAPTNANVTAPKEEHVAPVAAVVSNVTAVVEVAPVAAVVSNVTAVVEVAPKANMTAVPEVAANATEKK